MSTLKWAILYDTESAVGDRGEGLLGVISQLVNGFRFSFGPARDFDVAASVQIRQAPHDLVFAEYLRKLNVP